MVPAAVVVALLLLTGGGGSISGRGSGAPGTPIAAFIDQLASPWPKVQRPQNVHNPGQYHEPVSGGTRYGDSLEGYTEMLTGWRTHRPSLIRSGLLALRFGLGRAPHRARPSVFENLALAAAYNLATAHFPNDPIFTGMRPSLEAFLRQVKLIKLPAATYFGNHWLVEAVEVQELLRTGLRSNQSLAVLGGQRAYAAQLSTDLINKRIPAMARTGSVASPVGPAFVLSDPPDNPLVYQGLSFGFYARAIQMLGDRASGAARDTLVKIARASLLLTAPDGDLAYFGRNQEECWGLAATALGAWEAASLHETRPELDEQLRALAERAVRRLRTAYRIGPYGLYYTPIVRKDPRHALHALDPGAGGPSFAGMVQLMLEWALPVAIPAPRGATIPADHPLHAKLSHGESRVVVVRRGRFWYAVRPSTSGKHPDDIRADLGWSPSRCARPATGGTMCCTCARSRAAARRTAPVRCCAPAVCSGFRSRLR